MKIILIVLGCLTAVYVVYHLFIARGLLAKSAKLVAEAMPFQSAMGTQRVLVVGDSTAVGVGTEAAFSVPGRVGVLLNAQVENHAVSGARTRDLMRQLREAKSNHYDLVLIQIGANDILHGTLLSESIKNLTAGLAYANTLSSRVMWLSSGDIGNAPLFPFPVNMFFSYRTRSFRNTFLSLAKEQNVVYVDIFARPDPFGSDKKRYYAADMLHLSADGYGFWYSIVHEYIEKNWPELLRKDP